MLELKNPHAALAVLMKRPKAVKSIHVPPGSAPAWEEVALRAAAKGVRVATGGGGAAVAGRGRRSRQRETERSSSGCAMVEPPSPIPLKNLLRIGAGNGEAKGAASTEFGIWLGLDHVQDPQNLGALFRLAGFFGVRGIIMTGQQSAPVNATTCDVAAGAVESVAFSVVSNLTSAIEIAQKSELWVLGTCERAEVSVFDQRLDRNWMVVVGNEGSGMKRLVRERCDIVCSMPSFGEVPSLNVSTAAAAILTALRLSR